MLTIIICLGNLDHIHGLNIRLQGPEIINTNDLSIIGSPGTLDLYKDRLYEESLDLTYN